MHIRNGGYFIHFEMSNSISESAKVHYWFVFVLKGEQDVFLVVDVDKYGLVLKHKSAYSWDNLLFNVFD